MAEESSVRRRLRALAYPRWREFRLDDDNEVVLLVAFLEDRKVRALPVEERVPLRTNDAHFHDAFLSYVASLECPYTRDGGAVDRETFDKCVLWLLAHAIGVEYEDSAEATNEGAARALEASRRRGPAAEGGEDEAGVREALQPIAELLRVRTDGRSAAELTEAVRRAVQHKVIPAVEAAAAGGAAASMDHLSGGLVTGDPALDKAVAVLRMLYVSDLRDLQDRVNELIVSVQAYTADPKTDSRLGKVGR